MSDTTLLVILVIPMVLVLLFGSLMERPERLLARFPSISC